MSGPYSSERAARRPVGLITATAAASVLAIMGATIGACASTPPAPAKKAAEVRPLTQVDSVSISLSGTTATVSVKAMAPTPGYTNLTLNPVRYIQAPPDGIYDFTAVGTAPTGVVPFHTQPVAFSYRWTNVGPKVNGIRVHAGQSAVLARIPRE